MSFSIKSLFSALNGDHNELSKECLLKNYDFAFHMITKVVPCTDKNKRVCYIK